MFNLQLNNVILVLAGKIFTWILSFKKLAYRLHYSGRLCKDG